MGECESMMVMIDLELAERLGVYEENPLVWLTWWMTRPTVPVWKCYYDCSDERLGELAEGLISEHS
jgi:hypothetical protein